MWSDTKKLSSVYLAKDFRHRSTHLEPNFKYGNAFQLDMKPINTIYID